MNKTLFLLTVGLVSMSSFFVGSKSASNNVINADSTKIANKVYQSNSSTLIDNATETNNLVFTIATISETNTSKSVSVSVKLSDEIIDGKNNFYIGYYEEADKQFPAKLVYDLTYSNGKKETLSNTIIKKNTNGKYDGIGDYLGASSLNTFCDISCPNGSVLDKNSIKLVNVFEAKIVKENGNIVSRLPDYDHPYYVSGNLSASFKSFSFNDFLELKYNEVSTFSGYTSIKVGATSHGEEMYKTLRSSAYKKYQSQIEKGEFYIRTRLSFSGDSSYVLTFKDGSVVNQKTISSNVELSNDQNSCFFLIEGLDMNNLVNFDLYNVYINIGLYNTVAYKEVSGSNISIGIRFNSVDLGFVDIYDADGKVVIEKATNIKYFNYNAALIIAISIFTILYAGIIVFCYFYLKKKNANDEFKKMQTGQYIKTSVLGFLCIGSIIISILTILGRGYFVNNSFAVFNPLDVYIIIFSIASIILAGYFVRYFWILYKLYKEKKRNDRLKINQDVIDDGTLLIKKER